MFIYCWCMYFTTQIYYEHFTDRRICKYSFIESERDDLIRIAKESDLYIITQIEDETEEDQVNNLLKQYGIFDAGLNPFKVLFCATTQGRGHMSRQLESTLHIDGME
eukprot:gene3738-4657_t